MTILLDISMKGKETEKALYDKEQKIYQQFN